MKQNILSLLEEFKNNSELLIEILFVNQLYIEDEIWETKIEEDITPHYGFNR